MIKSNLRIFTITVTLTRVFLTFNTLLSDPIRSRLAQVLSRSTAQWLRRQRRGSSKMAASSSQNNKQFTARGTIAEATTKEGAGHSIASDAMLKAARKLQEKMKKKNQSKSEGKVKKRSSKRS